MSETRDSGKLSNTTKTLSLLQHHLHMIARLVVQQREMTKKDNFARNRRFPQASPNRLASSAHDGCQDSCASAYSTFSSDHIPECLVQLAIALSGQTVNDKHCSDGRTQMSGSFAS